MLLFSADQSHTLYNVLRIAQTAKIIAVFNNLHNVFLSSIRNIYRIFFKDNVEGDVSLAVCDQPIVSQSTKPKKKWGVTCETKHNPSGTRTERTDSLVNINGVI